MPTQRGFGGIPNNITSGHSKVNLYLRQSCHFCSKQDALCISVKKYKPMYILCQYNKMSPAFRKMQNPENI